MHWFFGEVEPAMKMYILNQTVADFTHIHYGDPMLQKVEVEEK